MAVLFKTSILLCSDRQKPVTVVTRDKKKAAALEKKGAKAAIIDIHDTEALNKLFQKGEYLFLLNPPAAPDTDTDMEEERTINSIANALVDSPFRKIVC